MLVVVLELLLRAEERRDQAACQVGRVGQGDGSTKVGRGTKLRDIKYYCLAVNNPTVIIVRLDSQK